MKPAYNERIQWSPNSSGRGGTKVRLGVAHTQEGDGTAASLANYLCNPNSQVSYHYTIDNNRNVVDVVDTDEYSWSVLSANPFTINYCFAGSRASWTSQQWLDLMGNGIEIAAWLWVQDAKKYGVSADVIGWDALKAGKQGFTDHNGITHGLGIGNHTDCGPNFPWGVMVAHIVRFAEGEPDVPPVSAIDAERAANEWLGNSTTGELTTPDNRGKYEKYEHGAIYWTPTTGAHTIPLDIWGKFEALKWETGAGYPTGLALDLIDHTRTSGTVVQGGTVQAFENGAIYAPRSGPACFVIGTIREMYKSTNYENGDLGWPTSDELDWRLGKVQTFEHGRIFWRSETNIAYAIREDGEPVVPLA